MKAVTKFKDPNSELIETFKDINIERPTARGHDLLVSVKAISVNPVDTKVAVPIGQDQEAKILGWDAAGVVVEVGESVSQYKVGDEVYYAGDITRPGTNSEFQLVDERIVGRKPSTLSFAEAAALPLTSITAYEALFDRLQVNTNDEAANQSILIIGGAGGVGSIAIQLAKKLTKLKVITTASREESENWCKNLGADLVINHHGDMAQQLSEHSIAQTDYILCLNNTDQHWQQMCHIIKPQGTICTIVENQSPLDMDPLKLKSAGLVWEFMFTRSMFVTDDMQKQQSLLNQMSQHFDDKTLKTTAQNTVEGICANNLQQAHQDIKQGKSIGKTVLVGW